MEALPSTIDCLPPEVLKRILEFLPLSEKKTVRLVCNVWRFVLDEFGPESVYFRAKLSCAGPDHNIILKSFVKSYRLITEVQVDDCDLRMSKLRHTDRRLPLIAGKLVIGTGNTQSTVVNFLKFGCKNASSLVLRQDSLNKTQRYVVSAVLMQNQNKFGHLTKLTIVVCQASGNPAGHHAKSCSTFLKFGKFPNLVDLDFKLVPHSISSILYKRIVQNFMLFLSNNVRSMRNLKYAIYVSSELKPRLELPVEGLILDNCTIEINFASQPNQIFLPNVIDGCGLKNLKFFVDTLKTQNLVKWTQTEEFDSALKNLLMANSTTLETVDLKFLQHFDANWLQPCINMKSLKLSLLRLDQNQGHQVFTAAPFKIPSLRIVEIFLIGFDQHPINYGYENLLTTIGASIEKLSFCLLIDSLFTGNEISSWTWLNRCKYLKSMFLYGDGYFNYMADNTDAPVFSSMLSFATGDFPKLNDPKHLMSAYWIAQKMPNLLYLTVGSRMSCQALKIVLGIATLFCVEFCGTWESNLIEIKDFVDSQKFLRLSVPNTNSWGPPEEGIRCKISLSKPADPNTSTHLL